jgi:hypothetical protein
MEVPEHMTESGVPYDLPARVHPDMAFEVVPRSVEAPVLIRPLLRSPRMVGEASIRHADKRVVVSRIKGTDE